ncbi:MAG TPA: hypothetical protein VNI01_14005 [Elusimicrobiota bacterium]|nr:hypothetical protein [Elusimicrobiota bacterium]
MNFLAFAAALLLAPARAAVTARADVPAAPSLAPAAAPPQGPAPTTTFTLLVSPEPLAAGGISLSAPQDAAIRAEVPTLAAPPETTVAAMAAPQTLTVVYSGEVGGLPAHGAPALAADGQAAPEPERSPLSSAQGLSGAAAEAGNLAERDPAGASLRLGTLYHGEAASPSPDPVPEAAGAAAVPGLSAGLAATNAAPGQEPPAPVKPRAGGLPLGFVSGAALGVLAPYLLGIVPIHFSLFSAFLLLGTLMAAALLALPFKTAQAAFRRFRPLPSRARGPRKLRWSRYGIGAAVGLALGVTPWLSRPALAPAVNTLIAPTRPGAQAPVPRDFYPRLSAHLRENPEGRRVLDELGGRLPPFFSAQAGDDHYSPMLDSVFIHSEAPLDNLVAIDAWIRANDDTILHELVHAVQARRRLGTPGLLTVNARENEMEAYTRQNLYLFEKWKADPGADEDGVKLGSFADFVRDPDGYLEAQLGSYRGVPSLPASSPFHSWYARLREEHLPRVLAEGALLVGDRYLARHRAQGRGNYQQSLALGFYVLAYDRAKALGDERLAAEAGSRFPEAGAPNLARARELVLAFQTLHSSRPN